MKIYDCFTFYNETDLLELRLTELYNNVDYFVIVESNQTFTNKPKPWNFDIKRFQQYADKIIYIQVTDMPNSSNAWDNEQHQRDAILRGLTDAAADDIVLISDADEIPRAEAIDYIRNSEQTIFALRMALFNFKLNYMRTTPGQYDIWAMAARRSVFDDITPNTLRNLRFNFNGAPYQFVNDGCQLVEHAGWHFGYLGDKNYLVDKAQSFSHQEVNRPEFIEQIDIEASIAARTEWDRSSTNKYAIVELDSYFPKTILNNRVRYDQWILDNTETKVLDILPPYNYNS
jgi:Glycosyltransferase family 17